MEDHARADLERDVRALCERGDHAGAATLALRGYGDELLRFLHAMDRIEADAADAFAEVSEALWRGLSTFAWGSSLRTWAYAIARNTMLTRRRNAGRRRKHVAVVGHSALDQAAQEVRTQTLAYLRTETRSRLQALRDSLPEEDRLLLLLRIDQRLPWKDLALVLAEAEGEAPLSDAAAARESARLRKRFQIVKDDLRARAKSEGLIE